MDHFRAMRDGPFCFKRSQNGEKDNKSVYEPTK